MSASKEAIESALSGSAEELDSPANSQYCCLYLFTSLWLITSERETPNWDRMMKKSYLAYLLSTIDFSIY